MVISADGVSVVTTVFSKTGGSISIISTDVSGAAVSTGVSEVAVTSKGAVSVAAISDAGGIISVIVAVGVLSSVVDATGIWIVIALPGLIGVAVDDVGCCGCGWFSVSSFGSTMVTDFLFFAK